MVKFLLALVVAGMGFVVFRMLLVKAGLAKPGGKNAAKNAAKGEKMSQLRRELDLLLWVPPALLVIGAIYALISMAMR
jgi:hypothetical protein